MFSNDLIARASDLLDDMRRRGLHLVTAESCTGGLVAGLFREIPGSSDVVERGWVTYSNEAKTDCLGVPAELIARYGAVSKEVALAMAGGSLDQAKTTDVSVAVTGVAGPGGGSADKPVGLVHLAAARRGSAPIHRECRFGDIGRSSIRLASVGAALELITQILETRS